uniref:GCF C-terminal domain-containing protein n=1 Tax=Anopheles farauti TaxID=69004 RepID=A0A182Q932_9DIPT
MSLFRKPKKPIQRRVFSGYDDEDEENGTPSGKDPPSNGNENGSARQPATTESGLAPEGPAVAASTVASSSEHRKRKEHRADASSKGGPGSLKATPGITKPSLLSFDDEEEGEVFQVKKSSHSKKVMKTLDKERRRKRHMEKSNGTTASSTGAPFESGKTNSSRKQAASPPSTAGSYETDSNDKIKREKCENSSSNIQTEIRTDDFVLVVKKSDPQNMILNGRAALCAGRNDMSSEEEETNEEEEVSDGRQHHHRFAKPKDDFKMYLENGVIPDAAMIHAARKRRQKAREQGEFIPIEEPKEEKNKKRTVQEDGDGDGSDEDDDRIDMSAITGAKEREERREQFYAVQREDSDAEDSDIETKEWENQQIRKGVTGAQLVSAQQESVISQYLIGSSFSQTFQNKSSNIMQEGGQSAGDTDQFRNLSTAALLEKAYAASGGPLRLSTSGHKPRPNAATAVGGRGLSKASDTKPTGPRMPQQILAQLTERQRTTEELNRKHDADIEHITQEIKLLGMDYLACEQKAPVAAAKYRFYQEFRCYVADLVECLNEKVPLVTALEQRALQLMAKHSGMLIERRRQDMRDQAKEVTDASKMIKRTGPDDQERVRRAAEREGRRTRRRRDREKNETADSHFDGMSSDDEIPDMEAARYRSALQEIELEARQVFADAAEEYGEVAGILGRFEQWRQRDMPAYSDAYVSLCLPKILAPLIRLEHVCWNPLTMEAQVELESEQWYRVTAGQFCCQATTEAALAADPDVRLIPTLVEKIFLPKLAALVEQYWDPLSTTQTFRLVRLLKRFVRDYPSLRVTCKPLRVLFQAILDKLKQSIDNDVFIPIFPKQAQEAKSSFFQRQFCSGLKLLRNITSWQGILADAALKELAIGSLLNRYLLNGMRVCTPVDAIAKASTVVYTLPRVWLSPGTSVVQSMEQFVNMLQHLQSQLDPAIPQNGKLIEQISKLLSSLHVVSPKSVTSAT